MIDVLLYTQPPCPLSRILPWSMTRAEYVKLVAVFQWTDRFHQLRAKRCIRPAIITEDDSMIACCENAKAVASSIGKCITVLCYYGIYILFFFYEIIIVKSVILSLSSAHQWLIICRPTHSALKTLVFLFFRGQKLSMDRVHYASLCKRFLICFLRISDRLTYFDVLSTHLERSSTLGNICRYKCVIRIIVTITPCYIY